MLQAMCRLKSLERKGERILSELPTLRPAWTVMLLGLGWAGMATLRLWLLLQLARFMVDSMSTPCSACKLAGACGPHG